MLGTRASQAPLSSRSNTARYVRAFNGATFFRDTAPDRARSRAAFPAEGLVLREPESSFDTVRIGLVRASRAGALLGTRAFAAAEAARFLSLRAIKCLAY